MSNSIETEGLTVAQDASRLGVGEFTVRRLVKRGALPAYKAGGALRIRRAAVEAFMDGKGSGR